MVETTPGLRDADVQRFIREGYLTVLTDFPTPVHEDIYARLETVYEREGNPGNNLLPRIPQIQCVFDHPAVRGALTRILGPNYAMHPHRHGHLNPPGSKGQSWHKDDYVYDAALRHPRPRFVLALYYPQDVTIDMGPTGLIPGRHYDPALSDADPARTTETSLGLCAPRGAVTIVHNDSWHCALPNRSAKKRYMLKFLFERLEEPGETTDGPAWETRRDDPLDLVHADVWRYLHGQPSPPPSIPWSAEEAGRLRAQIQMGDGDGEDAEAARLRAAYTLAAFGAIAVPTLCAALREEASASTADARFTAKTPGNSHGINPAACPAGNALAAIGRAAVAPLTALLKDENAWVRTMAADTLGNIGPAAREAVAALGGRLADENPRVRRHAAEALGRIGPAAAPAIGALIDRVRDPEAYVRHNVALALAKLGQPAQAAIPALLETLVADDDRYVRHFAALALRRLGTPEAHSVLLDVLFTSRWCEKTSPDTMY